MIRVESGGIAYFINFQHHVLGARPKTSRMRYELVMQALTLASKASPSSLTQDAAKEAIAALHEPLTAPTRRTLCKVSRRLDDLTPVQLVVGESYTDPSDNFCRKTGRWWSMTRALDLLAESHQGPEPGDVVEAYFNRGGTFHHQELLDYIVWCKDEFLVKHPREMSEAA